jgi:hypothetical protein
MTDHPVRSRHLISTVAPSEAFSYAAAVGVLLFSLAAGGCAERRHPTLPWATVSIVHPRVPVISTVSNDLAVEEAPELQLDLPLPVPNFPSGANPRPQRPRVATPPPVAAEPSKPQTPFVAPQLSVEESSTAQQETTASLWVAEKGLSAAQGKTLSATQSDMVSKITGFMADARAAAGTGDWTSAQTLARKAQLLSEELTKSLQQ